MKSCTLSLIVALAMLTACTSDSTPAPAPTPIAPGPTVSVTSVPALAQTTSQTTSVVSPSGSSTPVSSDAGSIAKIEEAERAGKIDHDTALVYELYAALDYSSLPSEYRSENSAADPEGTTVLAELSERLDQLPADLKAKVEPFFKRPSDPDSFWAKRMAKRAKSTFSLASTSHDNEIPLDYVDAANTPVRVWYAVPLGATEEKLASELANEVDKSDMWNKEKKAMLGHTPCSDEKYPSPVNGGNGSLDIYLIYPSTGLNWNGREASLYLTGGTYANGVTLGWAPGMDGCPRAAFIVLNAQLSFDKLKDTTAHELFHAFEYSFKSTLQGDHHWWAEASAMWAEDLVYPDLNFEQPYISPYWSEVVGADGPLDDPEDYHAYAAYIWAFYLRQKAGGDETVIGKLWQASESVVPIAAMHDLDGWNEKFKEFALWNWNKEPVIKYQDGDLPLSEVMLAQNTMCMADDCIMKLGKRNVPISLEHDSVQYYKLSPEIDVEQLRFDLKGIKGKNGTGVQAIISIGNAGQPGSSVFVEDWSKLDERTFCMALSDVRTVVLVVSNSSVADSTLTGSIGVEALKDHCGGSFVTYTFTENASSSGADACGGVRTSQSSYRLSMVVSAGKDGKGTATVSSHHDSISQATGGSCGDTNRTVRTTSEGAGTVETNAEWSVTRAGALHFEAFWDDHIRGTESTVVTCSDRPCDYTTSEDQILEWDQLAFDAQVDPKPALIVGSQTSNHSEGDSNSSIVTTWSLSR